MKRLCLILVMLFLLLGLSAVVPATESIQKCGLNIFFVRDECDELGYRKAYFLCCDGYEEEHGDDTTCELPETWQEIAETVCAGHCITITPKAIEPIDLEKGIQPRMAGPPQPFTSAECNIINDLLEHYSEAILDLRNAELEGNEQEITEIRNTITRFKQQIAEYSEKCQAQINALPEENIQEIKTVEINSSSQIRIKPGEMNIDNVTLKTTDRRILVNVGDRQINIRPRETEVVINDGNLLVTAEEVSIEENTLRIGNSDVKVAPTDVLAKYEITKPSSIDLMEENGKAVYKIRIQENRRLFGFIPIKVRTMLTIDAFDIQAEIIKKEAPWWAFLTFGGTKDFGFKELKPKPSSLGEE